MSDNPDNVDRAALPHVGFRNVGLENGTFWMLDGLTVKAMLADLSANIDHLIAQNLQVNIIVVLKSNGYDFIYHDVSGETPQ